MSIKWGFWGIFWGKFCKFSAKFPKIPGKKIFFFGTFWITLTRHSPTFQPKNTSIKSAPPVKFPGFWAFLGVF